MIKSEKISIFLHKTICCGCVLHVESPHRIHIQNIWFYGERMIIKVKNWYFVKTLYEYGDVHVMCVVCSKTSNHQNG